MDLSDSSILLWCYRDQTNLWNSIPLRTDRLWIILGSDRTISKDVTDCATLLEAIASHDEKDSTSVRLESYDFTSALKDDVKGMKIGIPKDYFGEGLDEEVKEAVLAAAKTLEEKGAIVEEFDLGLVEYAIPAYYVIAAAEASSNLSRFDGVKYGYRAKDYEGTSQHVQEDSFRRIWS